MKIEILKPFKLLTVGTVLDIDAEYSANLIKKGIAKSLEGQREVKEEEVQKTTLKKIK
jgi:hypothetical protein